MWHHVVLVRTSVSVGRIACIIKEERIKRARNDVTNNLQLKHYEERLCFFAVCFRCKLHLLDLSSPILFTLMMAAILSSETLALSRTARRHMREGGILRFLFSSSYENVVQSWTARTRVYIIDVDDHFRLPFGGVFLLRLFSKEFW
jgi:hypothetical protein